MRIGCIEKLVTFLEVIKLEELVIFNKETTYNWRIGRDGNVGRVGRIIDFKNWYHLGELARIRRIGNIGNLDNARKSCL